MANEPASVLPSRSPSDAASDATVRVLIVDDEPILRRSLARILMSRGFEVLTAENGEIALSLLSATVVDVMLVDLIMPKLGGIELLTRLRESYPDVEVVMMTAHGSIDTALSAVRAGAYDFLTKPFQSPDLVPLLVTKAAEHKRLLSLTRDLEQRLEDKERFGDLVGSSQRMRDVYRMALGVAPTNTTVLLLGESGTGKELVARAIHQHSDRSRRPFVTVNCGAIPPDLVESELFGHVRGAFTGAHNSRTGLFESADKGTVLLDEIGELPPAAQVKLLRTLQEGEIKRVGSSETRTVDVRVIAATNVDLREQIAAGKFREDLFYRLHVIAIHLPSLRQRKDDIPLLAYHFLHKYARRVGRDVKRISVDAMRLLCDYHWPGNVRELENSVERAVVLCRSETVGPTDLPFSSSGDPHQTSDETTSEEVAVSPALRPSAGWLDLPYPEAKNRVMDAFHTAYMNELLRRTDGNMSEAARQAGLDRSNFRRLLKRR